MSSLNPLHPLLKTWAALALVAVGAFMFDHVRESKKRDELRSAGRIGFLIPKSDRSMPISGLRLIDPMGNGALYVRMDGGTWRCPTFFNAVASTEGIAGNGGLIDALIQAQGAVQSDDPARAVDYGLGSATKITVLLHGPDLGADPSRDVRVRVELGSHFDGQTGGYVRRGNSSAVWAIDTDPWKSLEGPKDRPPLLDPELLPRSSPTSPHGLHRIRIEHPDGTSFTLQMDELPRDPKAPPGPPQYRWTMTTNGGAPVECLPSVSMDYAVWILRAAWSTLEDFAKNPPPTTGVGRIVFLPKEGKSTELVVGAPRPDGTVPVWNPDAKLLCIVAKESQPLLLATADQLLAPPKGDPWQPQRK